MDLRFWKEYGGSTAEKIAKRLVNKYRPSPEELKRACSIKKEVSAASEDEDKLKGETEG